jgi:hypothetical protein
MERRLAEKGRSFVLPPEIHDAGQRGGSRAEPQAEIVKCFDGGRRKETRSRAAAHTPELRSGRSRVGVGGWDIR